MLFPSLYPSDVPEGFSVSQREEPREGGDLYLTCVANKYLYTALSWQKVNDTEDAHLPSLTPRSQQITSGEFSNSLVLLLSNLTASDSGAYRCSARHLITRQETHLDTHVVVTSEWSKINDLWLISCIFWGQFIWHKSIIFSLIFSWLLHEAFFGYIFLFWCLYPMFAFFCYFFVCFLLCNNKK